MVDTQRQQSGELRSRLVLERPVYIGDGGGSTSRSWQTATSLWGAVVPLAPASGVEAEQPGGRVRYRVTCRYRTDIKTGQRFRLGNRILEIDVVVDPDGRRRWIECRCQERQS